MALETLLGVKTIDGFMVEHDPTDAAGRTAYGPVRCDHVENMITFKIQNGPIKENGVNGCQVDTIVKTSLLIVQGLQKKFPCRENALVITKLEEALHWLEHRTKDRTAREVEGTNRA